METSTVPPLGIPKGEISRRVGGVMRVPDGESSAAHSAADSKNRIRIRISLDSLWCKFASLCLHCRLHVDKLQRSIETPRGDALSVWGPGHGEYPIRSGYYSS